MWGILGTIGVLILYWIIGALCQKKWGNPIPKKTSKQPEPHLPPRVIITPPPPPEDILTPDEELDIIEGKAVTNLDLLKKWCRTRPKVIFL